MTEKLKTLMREQADSVDFPAPDLDAMLAAGDRRVRHRRFGAVAGVAAVAAGVTLVAPFLPPEQRAVEPAGPAAPGTEPLSWVDGTTLHRGAQSFDLGFRPLAFVRTTEGYVLSDRDGRVWSWQDGEVGLAGNTDPRRPRLVADAESGMAGWVNADRSEYVVIDQVAGTIRGYEAPRGTDPEDFAAIDDGTGFWHSAEGLVAFDLTTRRTTPLEVAGAVADVEDGLLAVRTDAGVSVRDAGGEELRRLDGFHGEVGSFSTDGRYFSNDADEPQVFDVTAGERVLLDVGGRGFATGYEWLGDTTLAVIAADQTSDRAPAVLLSCEVPGGGCTEVAELGDLGGLARSLVLPVGEAMG